MTAKEARRVSMAARSRFMWERIQEAAEAGRREVVVTLLDLTLDDVDLLVTELVNMGYTVNGRAVGGDSRGRVLPLYQLVIDW